MINKSLLSYVCSLLKNEGMSLDRYPRPQQIPEGKRGICNHNFVTDNLPTWS